MLMTMPLPGHPYHCKTEEELNVIIGEASAKAAEIRGGNSNGRREHLTRVDAACAILNYRARGSQEQSTAKTIPHVRAQPSLAEPTTPIARVETFCPDCEAKRKAIAQREQRKLASAERKLDMIKRIEALMAAMPNEAREQVQ